MSQTKTKSLPKRNEVPVADTWAFRGINLPTHLHLKKNDIERITSALRTALVNQ